MPYNFLNARFKQDGSRPGVFANDTTLTSMIKQFPTMINMHDRQRAFNKLSSYIDQQYLIVPISYPNETFVTSPKIRQFEFSGQTDAPINYDKLKVSKMTNIVKHFIRLLIYLIIISFVLFFLLENTTGNPAVQYLQEHGVAQITPERIKMAQDKLGLSQAMPVRYVQWLGNVFTGDLGTSFSNGEPVTERISQAIVPTIN